MLGGSGRGSQSVQNRAKRILASQATAHNVAVMRELGEAGVDRRDHLTGASDVRERLQRGREERESNEAAARLMAEELDVREAKRRKEAATPKQRIEAKFKAMGNRGRR